MKLEDVRERLSKRIFNNDILELLYYRQERKDIADEIIRCAFDADDKVARNALWVLTRDMIDETLPFRHELASLALSTSHEAIRRLSLTLLERMDWGIEDLRVDLLDFCLEKILSESETVGVRSLCIKLSYQLSRHYPELLGELKSELYMLADTPMSPAVACSRKNVLNKIEGSGCLNGDNSRSEQSI